MWAAHGQDHDRHAPLSGGDNAVHRLVDSGESGVHYSVGRCVLRGRSESNMNTRGAISRCH